MATNPTNLTLTNQGTDVLLTWDAATPADGYNVYRDSTLIGVALTASFLDTTALPGELYTWKVIAFSACGFSEEATATGTTDCADPGDISGATATQTAPTQITIEWTATLLTAGYKVQRSVNGGSFIEIADTTATSYVDTVTPLSTYVYRVYSYNACADGDIVETESVVPGCDFTSGPPDNIEVTAISLTAVID
jgi:fibronectin type 3 domain-containing protein